MKVTNFFIRELGVTLNEYNNQIIDSGFEWVHFKHSSNPILMDQLLVSDVFWSWWWAQWEARNEKLYDSLIAYYNSNDSKWLISEHQKTHSLLSIKESNLVTANN